MTEYKQTRDIVEQHFIPRLALDKVTQDVYLDNEPFDIAKFRDEVYREHNVVLDNDKYIYELTYFFAKNNRFSPIEDYLNKCVKKYPDINYQDIFAYFNQNVLNIDTSKSLETLYFPKTLVAAVNRIYNPGCKHDTVLIIKGKQGFYKTSLFAKLAGKDWFTSLSLRNYNADELMVCNSKWIVELGECEDTIKPTAMSKLKEFITKQSDSYRNPYATNPITFPRQFVLVGTTNKDKFLQDSTGNRRFWVIELSQKIDIDWIKGNRDLVWAAAVLAFKDGYITYLNETEQQLSDVLNTRKYQV